MYWQGRARRAKRNGAYTITEVMVTVVLVAFLTMALHAGFSQGFLVLQTTREDLRATQILVQRMETIRLMTWSQLNNTNYVPQTFVDLYGATSGGNSVGTRYYGRISNAVPAYLPAAYRTNMRVITVTLNWTNYHGSRPVAHSRMMNTHVARSGMQNYVYGK